MEVLFDGDSVCLHCQGCGRKFGNGAPAREARTLCVYFNGLLGEEGFCLPLE